MFARTAPPCSRHSPVRAVGTACATNPLPVMLPYLRAVHSHGSNPAHRCLQVPVPGKGGSCSATTRKRHAMTMLTVISPACSEVQSTHSRPSAIHLPGWLNMSQQRQIAEAFHEWSTGPLPIRATSLPGGHQMSVRTLRLGRHQQPSTRNASVPDGQRVTEFPGWLAYIGQAAISAIYGPLAAVAYRPDTALVNYYDPGLRPWGGAVRSRLLMPYAAFAAAKTAHAWKDRTPGNLADLARTCAATMTTARASATWPYPSASVTGAPSG